PSPWPCASTAASPPSTHSSTRTAGPSPHRCQDRPVDMYPTATTTHIAGRAPHVAVLPIGSFEQHGSFLPLATDSIVATAIAGAIAARYTVLLLPPVTISCSHEHAAWPGTVSISHTTLSAIIADIRTSLTGSGITKLILINGHGGNYVLSNFTDR